MKKYVVSPCDLPTYSPPRHSRTTNRRLLGPGRSGSNRLEVILGEVEYGGQADPHVHSDLEQPFFVLQGKAELEIKGEKVVVGPEDFIFLPPGTIHRVTPLKGPPLKLLIIYSPPLSSSKTPFEEEK